MQDNVSGQFRDSAIPRFRKLHDIYYSFPFQLLILHFRNNHILIITWLALMLLVTGNLAKIFGIQYLFTDPEYMGSVNPLSFSFVGGAFGVFIMVWHLSAYLLNAFRFPFLASLSRPFSKFVSNNMILPIIGLIVMIWAILHIQVGAEAKSWFEVFSLLLGWFAGFLAAIGIIGSYLLFTNKDYRAYTKHLDSEKLNREELSGLRHEASKWKVETYLGERLKPRLVRNVEHYPPFILQKVYRQNHLNAFILLSSGIIILICLGFLGNYEYFRIPAGASILLLFSVVISLSSAVSFWFKKWRFPVFILLLILFNSATRSEYLRHASYVYGLNYKKGTKPYNVKTISESHDSLKVEKDRNSTIQILENWKAKQSAEKPIAIFICSSGGGHKAGIWTTEVLQKLDRELNGQLINKTILMSGASGGMLGSAFYRSLKADNNYKADSKAMEAFSNDLLNSLSFAVVSNDIFPNFSRFHYNGHSYYRDRGYAFEQQFNQNTKGILDHPLIYYRDAEKKAAMPMVFLTPTIINDGRRLLISAQDISYMTSPYPIPENSTENFIDGIEFRKFFQDLNADSLRFLSALRMNCTYPYILPNVNLPTNPPMEIMDAGFRDNTGVSVACRFIWNLKDWIKENTSGVIIIQISAVEREADQKEVNSKGVIEGLFSPLGFTRTILKLQRYEQANYIQSLNDNLGKGKVNLIQFNYNPHQNNQRASMSFHLTQREKEDIKRSLNLEFNRKSFKEFHSLLNLRVKHQSQN